MRSGWLVGLLVVVVAALFATVAILMTAAADALWSRAVGAPGHGVPTAQVAATVWTVGGP